MLKFAMALEVFFIKALKSTLNIHTSVLEYACTAVDMYVTYLKLFYKT